MPDPRHGQPAAARLELDLSRRRDAAAIAREEVRTRFGEALTREKLGDVQLAVSELVGNAFLHGSGAIRLVLELDGGRLRGEVADEGGGFEHAIRERGADDVTGRGLSIVAALADEWGVREGSTHVWWTMRTSSTSDGASQPRLGEEAAAAPGAAAGQPLS